MARKCDAVLTAAPAPRYHGGPYLEFFMSPDALVCGLSLFHVCAIGGILRALDGHTLATAAALALQWSCIAAGAALVLW